MSIGDMCLDDEVNRAVSTKHTAKIKWLTQLISFGLEALNCSIIPAFD